jgi:hypothetical protein
LSKLSFGYLNSISFCPDAFPNAAFVQAKLFQQVLVDRIGARESSWRYLSGVLRNGKRSDWWHACMIEERRKEAGNA